MLTGTGNPHTITVLIPARNAQATISSTLDSLVAQTHQDFKVRIVDDASSDGTLDIVHGFSSRLDLQVSMLATNAGVAGALNHGLAQIDSQFVCRLDADDMAMPTRLEKQLEYLVAHPETDVCSSWMEVFYPPAEGRASHLLAKPETDAAIKTALVQYCALSHPACMIRKRFFDDVGVFDIQLDYAEDYDLWCRGALLGKRYVNLPEPLTRYRQHANQVGQQKRQLQYERDLQVKRKYISALLGGASAGYLPEFFHLLSAFTNREIALQVIEQSMPQILRLGCRVADQALYADIVSRCLGRHLRAAE